MKESSALSLEPVDIFQIRFPRMNQAEAVKTLMNFTGQERAVGVAFPDMSTMNQAQTNPEFKKLLQSKVRVFNDGVGMAWISRCQGKPFPANLNGTDLCPALLANSPVGTRVFLLGTKSDDIEIAREKLSNRFKHIAFVGVHHGYFTLEEEPGVMKLIRAARPAIVFVGMGNPRQVEFIARHLDDPGMKGTLFLAIGGFFDYWAGNINRAPLWVRRLRLEWLFLIFKQPHKLKRYLVGGPLFLIRGLWAQFRNQHACPPQNPSQDELWPSKE